MITSVSNARVKALGVLVKKAKERKRQGLFVVEGARIVREAPLGWLEEIYCSESFWNRPEAESVFGQLRGLPVPVTKLSDSVYKSVSDTQTPQGILGVVRMPVYQLSDLLRVSPPLLLVLEGIQDPGNLGTIFRTGEAAGVTGLIMSRTTVDLFNPKTIRSTMGSIYRMPFVVAEDLQETVSSLAERGISFYAAHLRGEKNYDRLDYRGPCGFLIGNEGNGLSDEMVRCAESCLRIPMQGQVESLNAAVSAAVLVYEASRQRRT